MNLPPWEPRTDAEVEAFKDFVLDELDRLNVASSSGPEAELGVEMLTSMLRQGALRRELEELGAYVPPPKRKRGGQRKHIADDGMSLRLAIRDVERMRAIFRAHWGKVNRHHRPTREDIAAEFHGLTDGEKRVLENHFAKTPKGSSPQKA